MQIAMINDNIVPLEELDAAYLDRGLYFGDGVYEVIRSYDDKIFALDDHIERLQNSLAGIEIDGIDPGLIKERILTAFEEAQISNARIYLHITRGSAVREHNWEESIRPNFFLTVTALPDFFDLKKRGIAVCTCADLRWKKCWIKSLNLLPNVLARKEAARKGCDEAILVDENNIITEGSGSSFFAIVENKIQTAPLTANILPSITRKYVLENARDLNLEIVEESLTPDDAESADELFITVTTKDIVPVVKFDGVQISGGNPGQITKKLITEFSKEIDKCRNRKSER